MDYIVAIIPINNSRLGRQYQVYKTIKEAIKATQKEGT